MADDPERDIYPTKEMKGGVSSSIDLNPTEKHYSPEKRFGLHLSRADLEDQFYRFKEENLQLKKAAKKQEDELKRLATKMTRLLREKKSLELSHSPGHKRDLELEEMVEDLQDRIRQLEKTNTHLREKALVAKQQVIMQARRPNPYSHIPPKVNSSNFKSGNSPYTSSINIRGKNLQSSSRKTASLPIPSYALGLLEEARTELSNLKMLVSNQRNETEMYQQENEVLKQSMRMREIEFDEELNILKSQLTQKQRQHVQENLDLIRLHRELKQKNSKIIGLQAQYNDMEEKMRILKLNHDHLVKDMDDLTFRYKNEQKRNFELLGELKKAEITFSASSELQDRMKSLMKENDILRETNEKLLMSALNVEKERSLIQLEQVFKEKISNLESALENQTKTKNTLEEELAKEKGNTLSKEELCTALKMQINEMKTHIEDLETKVKLLKSENVEFDDLHEALRLLKLQREGKLEDRSNPIELSRSTEPDTSEKKEDSNKTEQNLSAEIEKALESKILEIESLKSRLKVCETEHLETLHELDNVREILLTQCNMNKVLQDDMKSLTQKFEEQQKEYQAQLQEYSHLLDLRAARIQKLEKQLNDIAFGTSSIPATLSNSKKENSSPMKLSKGENIFEIHIEKIKFSKEGFENLSSPNSKVFLTWHFYEFELQSTPVVPAERSQFNFTSQYTVEVDDYFLCYLHENDMMLELNESLGVDFKSVAACQLNFSNIFTKPNGRIHGRQKLIGMCNDKNVDFGTIDYWTHFKIPMEDAFKFFKERIKALKYIHANRGISTAAANFLKQLPEKESHVNELHVKILRGINLKSRQKDVQPSTFCVYKFYDLPDQDTPIIPASNNPEFSAHHIFSLFIDSALEKYIMTENLYLYIFDDNDPDISTHIGRASIPLHTLAQNKPIKGIFELKKEGISEYGAVEVLIYWQFDYIQPSESFSINEMKEKFSYAPPPVTSSSGSDEEITEVQDPTINVSLMKPPVPKPRKSIQSQQSSSVPVEGDSNKSNTHSISSTSPIHEQRRQSSASESSKFPLNDQRYESPTRKNQDQEDVWSDVMSDTEKKAVYEETSDQEKQDLSYEDSDASESDYDLSLHSSKKQFEQVPTIVILVSHLQLKTGASVLENPLIKLLYIEYRFLDYPLEELETPFSLPKMGEPEKIVYNFQKVLHLKLKDTERWNLLSKMFSAESPDSSTIKFTVVSEPSPDEQNLDCEEIGFGSVDLRKILSNNKDIIQEDILIYDAKNTDTVIGSLNISIKALDALILLQTFVEF